MRLTREQKALLDRVAPLPGHIAEPIPIGRVTGNRAADEPNVCVCERPRLTGPCHCPRTSALHMPNECRACHRPVLTLTEDSE